LETSLRGLEEGSFVILGMAISSTIPKEKSFGSASMLMDGKNDS
jgi:hypothetical protein